MSALDDRDAAVYWHPCSHFADLREVPPFEVIGAEGARLHLPEGRSVLDAISSWWCKALGHRHPGLGRAVRDQLDRFEHVIAANTTHGLLVSVCERVLAAANGLPVAAWGREAKPGRPPGPYGKVFLADNGSTAVEVAVKMALQAQAQRGQPQRKSFVALENGYHGETVATLALGDCGLYGQPYEALYFPVEKLGPLPYRRGTHDPAWQDGAAAADAVIAQLAPRVGELAAIVYEPILQAAGGMRFYSPDFLARLCAWAKAHDVFLIADEIASGWGRLGTMLATHLVTGLPAAGAASVLWPDFVAVSKGLTAGFSPLSAVLTRDDIAALFDGPFDAGRSFLHSNTYTGHALGLAAASATLDAFDEERVLEGVKLRADLLARELNEAAGARPWMRGLRHLGLVAAFDLTAVDGTPLDPARRTGRRVQQEAFRRGVFLRPLGDTLYLFPPLNVGLTELEEMIAGLLGAADAILTDRRK